MVKKALNMLFFTIFFKLLGVCLADKKKFCPVTK